MRLSLVFLLAACAPAPAAGQAVAPQAARPALVVFITVDQMRPDYFERWPAQLTAGFKRLYDGSAFYARGEQDHAITETAPGHSTILTGRSPASTGIVTNELGVPDTAAPLVRVPGPGASPRRFRGTTMYDWMKAADPQIRVLSVSGKDRGAVLPIGRAKVPVFWYRFGIFTTSRWYADTLPAWLERWNERQGAAKLAGKQWDLLLDATSYAEPDSQVWERGGQGFMFPKRFSTDSQRVTFELMPTPYMDSLNLDVALEGVKALQLGKRPGRTDLLSISLSATDYIGHTYGPDSREIHDHIIRVDRFLGWFIDSLAKVVPLERTLYVLTADHGVTSFPEFNRSRGRMSGRANADTLTALADQALQQRHGKSFGLDFNNGLLYGDVAALKAAKVNVDSLSSALASSVARITGVTRIYTPRSLAAADTADVDAMRWRRSIPADFPWLAAASLAPGYIWSFSPSATTHGTTNADDLRVPILFMGPGITPGKYQRARTVDIAPTLAAILGVKPGEPVEGRVLPEVVKPR
ncbi:MAG TPA: alkaline phosphatase family protein [Gemmatimonadales bacterium]